MEPIEFLIYKRNKENPNKIEYVDQRTAQEVFEELRHRLECTGYLPDEYFLLDSEWENGRKIPADADIFCTTDYGASEGIYIDVYLKWYEDNNPVTKSFITGKTLGESTGDMDRMFLIGSAITKAFHGERGTFVRHMGEDEEKEPIVLSLTMQEQRLLIDSLIDKRNSLVKKTIDAERLLRRVTGSITEYINETGYRPMEISDYDTAVLAIHDGNLSELQAVGSKLSNRVGDLLLHAAGRPGTVGRKMCLLLLSEGQIIPYTNFMEACKKAIDIGDKVRVLFLMEQAEDHTSDFDRGFYGDLISYAYGNKQRHISSALLERCTPEQIAAADPKILVQAAAECDYSTASAVVEKGIDANSRASQILRAFTIKNNQWMFANLLERGMRIDSSNFSALKTCIDTDQLDAAKYLIDHGMDFDKYQNWSDAEFGIAGQSAPTYQLLLSYWQEQQTTDNFSIQ